MRVIGDVQYDEFDQTSSIEHGAEAERNPPGLPRDSGTENRTAHLASNRQ